MTRSFILSLLLSSPLAWSVLAADGAPEQNAIQLVKRYSETIACNIEDEYKSVRIGRQEEPVYVVMWTGDVGCAGGSGTTTPNFTVVFTNYRGDQLVDVARSRLEPPFRAERLFVRNGNVVVEGLTHGSNDANCCPSLKATSTYELTEKGFKLLRPAQSSRR